MPYPLALFASNISNLAATSTYPGFLNTSHILSGFTPVPQPSTIARAQQTIQGMAGEFPFAPQSQEGAYPAFLDLLGNTSPDDWIEANQPLWNELLDAMKQDDLREIERLLSDQRIPPNSRGYALHFAAYLGNEDACRLLIESGADVNYKNTDGLTPLVQAVINGDERIIALLYQHGAIIEHCGNNEKTAVQFGGCFTPLWHAIRASRIGPVRLLVQYGANIHNALRYTLYPKDLTDNTEIIQFLNEQTKFDPPGYISSHVLATIQINLDVPHHELLAGMKDKLFADLEGTSTDFAQQLEVGLSTHGSYLTSAILYIADMYENGMNCKKDLGKSRSWTNLAMLHGDLRAITRLSNLSYANQSKDQPTFGDLKYDLDFLKAAAEHGYGPAILTMSYDLFFRAESSYQDAYRYAWSLVNDAYPIFEFKGAPSYAVAYGILAVMHADGLVSADQDEARLFAFSALQYNPPKNTADRTILELFKRVRQIDTDLEAYTRSPQFRSLLGNPSSSRLSFWLLSTIGLSSSLCFCLFRYVSRKRAHLDAQRMTEARDAAICEQLTQITAPFFLGRWKVRDENYSLTITPKPPHERREPSNFYDDIYIVSAINRSYPLDISEEHALACLKATLGELTRSLFGTLAYVEVTDVGQEYVIPKEYFSHIKVNNPSLAAAKQNLAKKILTGTLQYPFYMLLQSFANDLSIRQADANQRVSTLKDKASSLKPQVQQLVTARGEIDATMRNSNRALNKADEQAKQLIDSFNAIIAPPDGHGEASPLDILSTWATNIDATLLRTIAELETIVPTNELMAEARECEALVHRAGMIIEHLLKRINEIGDKLNFIAGKSDEALKKLNRATGHQHTFDDKAINRIMRERQRNARPAMLLAQQEVERVRRRRIEEEKERFRRERHEARQHADEKAAKHQPTRGRLLDTTIPERHTTYPQPERAKNYTVDDIRQMMANLESLYNIEYDMEECDDFRQVALMTRLIGLMEMSRRHEGNHITRQCKNALVHNYTRAIEFAEKFAEDLISPSMRLMHSVREALTRPASEIHSALRQSLQSLIHSHFYRECALCPPKIATPSEIEARVIMLFRDLNHLYELHREASIPAPISVNAFIMILTALGECMQTLSHLKYTQGSLHATLLVNFIEIPSLQRFLGFCSKTRTALSHNPAAVFRDENIAQYLSRLKQISPILQMANMMLDTYDEMANRFSDESAPAALPRLHPHNTCPVSRV